ncbi:membrane protein insertase YidC [Streptomyces sp. NA02950]|uniref:YidC/Oxa1 family membrane protein insertase n=1 Tax=Streptomyces sp. NA02950 TaxID=2742137 RepID=UPI0015922842|nr:membrane protein insertase YidC [Streptomyces sp. NA02950]QKV94745.1 membrane protein insertase YidC [Streptomyces sp. NA02950]
MSLFSCLGSLLSTIADQLDPLFGASATAAAIVVFTLGVRAALHPLTRAAVRGEKARARLAPKFAELSRRHRSDPERMRRALGELRAEEGSSPMTGCLPAVVQLPVFFVMYHVFSTGSGAGDLLDHTLAGAPLGGRWDGALGGSQGLVHLALFVLIAAVATWTWWRARRTAVPGASPGLARVLPLLSFGTLVTAAVVPLAAGLYLATSTTWTAVERALLHRGAS